MNFDILSLVGQVSEWLGVIAVIMLIGLSKRFRQTRPIVFMYPRREGIVSLYLFSVILLLSIFSFTNAFTKRPIIFDLMPNALNAYLVLAILCGLIFLAALGIRRQPIRSAGWKRQTLAPSIRLSVALIFLTIFLRGAIYFLLDGIGQDELLVLLVWIGIAVAEETIFRGYILPRVSSWLGNLQGLFLTSFLYTMWSFPRFIGTSQSLEYPIAVLLGITFIQGLILGWIARKSDHIAAPILYRAVSEWITILA